jgi:hypothetical protein
MVAMPGKRRNILREWINTSEQKIKRVHMKTGGQKEQRLARMDLLPPYPLWLVAEHYGKSAEKYPPGNWEKGFDWSLSYAAAMRHLVQFWAGESTDPETGSHHLAATIFHCMALMQYEQTHPELDDRSVIQESDGN